MDTTEPTEPKPAPKKTPSRPGSQWATGKRRAGKSKAEARGFARGAKTK